MFKKQSLTGRIFVGKVLGFFTGVLALLILPLIPIETGLEFKIGFILLLTTMGTMIGMIGVYTHHPVFPGMRLHWWLRGPVVGILFFLILVLLAKDELMPFMSLDVITWTGLTSPYWALIDGAFLGGIIGYFSTKIAGEGNIPIE
jgi:hypothetical protein